MLSMKVGGSIFIDSKGAGFLVRGEGNVDLVAKDFVEMRQEAERCCDKLYYVYDEDWGVFFEWFYSPYPVISSNLSQVALQMLIDSNISSLTQLSKETDFGEKSEPRTNGGFRCEGIYDEEFVCDRISIQKWHYKWFLEHPDKIDWTESQNTVFPCYVATHDILRTELQKKQVRLNIHSKNVTNYFYDFIVKVMSPNERISYSKELGSAICRANYYKRESELERLEQKHGNNKAKVIFSILKDGKYQFISIDTQHCMFELCDEKGDHIAELRFDGSFNGTNTREVNHGLCCVNEWKQKII